LLIAVISLILVDLDNLIFPQNFMLSIKEELQSEGIKIEDENDPFLKCKRNERIQELLLKKIQNIQPEKLISLKDMLKREIGKEPQLIRHLTEINQTKFNLRGETSVNEISSAFKQIYSEFLQLKMFDERLFLEEITYSDCSPVKITPFKRQKLYNFPSQFSVPMSQSGPENTIKKPSAFKQLNFDMNNSMNLSAGQTSTANITPPSYNKDLAKVCF
jgi:hypothetical protein